MNSNPHQGAKSNLFKKGIENIDLNSQIVNKLQMSTRGEIFNYRVDFSTMS